MLRLIKQNTTGLKYPLYASLTLSFASFGDAFLYPFLPQYADVMQIPVVWIGVLLSINRFIRIVFNQYVARLFAKFGVRPVTIAASVMAIASTVGYSLGWGLISLIVFRLLWGMAFAILRISTLAYALQQEYIGISMGVGKSVQELGPMFALWLGPVLLDNFSAANSFLLLAMFSVPSLLYAIALPGLNYIPLYEKRPGFHIPSLFNLMTFAASFIVEGVLIIVAGIFLAKNDPSLSNWAITTLVAGYLVYRRISFILFSPIAGAIADRIGFARLFDFSLLMIFAGLVLLLLGWVSVGMIIIFTFNSVNSAMAPGGASNNEADKIKAVTTNATWRDIGAASGTLTGGFLLSGSLLFETFAMATFILGLLLIIHFRKTFTA